jgi:hypothetical protein
VLHVRVTQAARPPYPGTWRGPVPSRSMGTGRLVNADSWLDRPRGHWSRHLRKFRCGHTPVLDKTLVTGDYWQGEPSGPARERTVALNLPDMSLELTTASGVFGTQRRRPHRRGDGTAAALVRNMGGGRQPAGFGADTAQRRIGASGQRRRRRAAAGSGGSPIRPSSGRCRSPSWIGSLPTVKARGPRRCGRCAGPQPGTRAGMCGCGGLTPSAPEGVPAGRAGLHRVRLVGGRPGHCPVAVGVVPGRSLRRCRVRWESPEVAPAGPVLTVSGSVVAGRGPRSASLHTLGA